MRVRTLFKTSVLRSGNRAATRMDIENLYQLRRLMLYPTELRADMKKAHERELFLFFWSEYKDSNLGPPGPKPGALPDCATLRLVLNYSANKFTISCVIHYFYKSFIYMKLGDLKV